MRQRSLIRLVLAMATLVGPVGTVALVLAGSSVHAQAPATAAVTFTVDDQSPAAIGQAPQN